MSTMLERLARSLASLLTTRKALPDTDRMSLREWADLPIHHPICDRAPR